MKRYYVLVIGCDYSHFLNLVIITLENRLHNNYIIFTLKTGNFCNSSFRQDMESQLKEKNGRRTDFSSLKS